ncbi:hypothetical protein DdX_11782 [Ditylenchus destructor]|uniref:Saposin B-type domain-containing protein n=1 Tax=Ditylenchus destructor TaxID=166010 RepID=A0AAD4R4D8_9BILA|nr:hypothetical protein DdX_11782 [Ditylenchus destructor]
MFQTYLTKIAVISVMFAVVYGVDEWNCDVCKSVMGRISKILTPFSFWDENVFVDDFKRLMVHEKTCYYTDVSNYIPACCEQGGSVHEPVDKRTDGRAKCAQDVWDFSINRTPNKALDPSMACLVLSRCTADQVPDAVKRMHGLIK